MEKTLLIINTKQFGYVAGYHYYAKYLKDDFSIRFICFDHKMPRVKMDNVDIRYLSMPRLRYLRLIYFVLCVLKELYSNKYHSVFMVYHKLAWLVKALCPFSNIVLDIRTGAINRQPLVRKFNNLFIRFNTIFFNKVTILSESLRKLLKLPETKTTILPLGAELFQVDRSYDAMKLFYLGTLNTRNIDQTVQGFSRFYRQYKDTSEISYDIVGYGTADEEARLNNVIDELGLRNVVVFHGRKNHDELLPFLEKCNIGVSYVPVTPFFDCQPPTKTYEYILSGMFCIATGTFENKRCISTQNGIICDSTPEAFSEALATVAEKRETFDSGNISASLKDFSWSNIVNNTLKKVLA